jgi:methylmalonyl-CoA mutase cobalamin-binding subunit
VTGERGFASAEDADALHALGVAQVFMPRAPTPAIVDVLRDAVPV